MRKKIVPFLGIRVWNLTLVFAISLSASGMLSAQNIPCAGAPTDTQTRCVKAISIPGNAIRSFDISWVDSDRGLYFLADRSNKSVDIVDTKTNMLIAQAVAPPPGFAGAVIVNNAVDNNHSGPDGVVSHGRWLYVGDGDSTLKVFDIEKPANPMFVTSISTFSPNHPTCNSMSSANETASRLDEMALSTDGRLLLAVNNATNPPYATLFAANGDDDSNSVSIIRQITVDETDIPCDSGLSIEQPAWDQEGEDGQNGLFYVSIPTIATNPVGCNFAQSSAATACGGGLLVIDPADSDTVDQNVKHLNECGPNGLTVGPHDNLLEGCTPRNEPGNTSELVINADSFNFANIGNITGADEVWFNKGDNRYYTGSSSNTSSLGGPVLGVIDAITNLLIEKIPQSSGSHSVAADARRNTIYVPQVAPASVVGAGGDTTTVGAGICGGTSGCIAVYTDTSHGGE